VGHRLNVLTNTMLRSAIVDYPARAGVKVVEAWVVRQVGHHSPISSRQIARHISADEAQICRAIQSLLERGFVARVEQSSNGREKPIELTTKGRAVFRVVDRMYRERTRTLLRGLSRKRQREFFETLAVIERNAQSLLVGAPAQAERPVAGRARAEPRPTSGRTNVRNLTPDSRRMRRVPESRTP
jgi:DNA-binding MarR family transcriptional regulator